MARTRGLIAAGLLIPMTVALAIAALSWGVDSISPTHALRVLFAGESDPSLTAVIQQVRAPRILMALVVGALLGVAGAVSQALFANPLAEPTIIGIASGGALGVLVAVALGGAAIGSPGALAGSILGAAAVSWLIARWDQRDPLALLLAGIALAAIGNAAVGLITSMAGRGDLRSIAFWSLGSLSLTTWSAVTAIALPALMGLALAMVLIPRLDYLALGRTTARHLGINIAVAQMLAFAALALLVGSAVALVGIIAFVGLVVPHLVRLLIGPRHRHVLPFSALLGAFLVLAADTAARTILVPMEIPIGLLTAVIGAPALLVVLKWVRAK